MERVTTIRLPLRSRCSALTLVELVVTTAVLALVLGQVVPAVKDARSGSLLAGCKDRLAQIAEASFIYAAADPNELVTPISVGDADPAAAGRTYTTRYGYGGRSGLVEDPTTSTSPFSGAFGLGAMDRPLNRILFKQEFHLPKAVSGRGGSAYVDWNRDGRLDLDVYHCPADGGFPGMHYAGWRDSGLSGYDYFGTSYIVNATLAGYLGPGSPLWSISPYRRSLSRIPAPSVTVLYSEAAAQCASFATNHDLDQSGCYWPYECGSFIAHGWHGTDFRFSIALADGAVRDLEIRGYGRTPSPDIMPPGCVGGPCDCILIRTSDWRLDTFPAPMIDTPKLRVGDIAIFEVVQ